VARLWFRGVPVDRDGSRLVVAYAVVEIDSEGSAVVARTRLAVFTCRHRRGPNFDGCTGRRVEYGDLATPRLRVTRPAPARLIVSGRFPTYAYRGAVDRGRGLPVHWTGRAYPIVITCSYDPVAGRPLPDARIVLGSGPGSWQATLDLGYPDEVTP
jgi:hypothetical protein